LSHTEKIENPIQKKYSGKLYFLIPISPKNLKEQDILSSATLKRMEILVFMPLIIL
jgi:hypothetical protein